MGIFDLFNKKKSKQITVDYFSDKHTNDSYSFSQISNENNDGDDVFVIENSILIQYRGNNEYVSIPESVRIIGQNAFKNCHSIITIDIPNSVERIDIGAFEGCDSLVDIYIPDSVTSIGMRAFYGCRSIKDLFIPISVTRIEEAAFAECSSLTSINIPTSITIIDWFVFSNCTSLRNVNIPRSITKIGSGSFEGCTSLKSIYIPDSVESIANEVFSGCVMLEEINIPNSVKSIGYHAFENCVALKEVCIPKSVRTIECEAFLNCISATIILSKPIENIESDAFLGCKSVLKKQETNSFTGMKQNNISTMNGKYVFISYSQKNEEYAEDARHLLKSEGIGVWMAPYDIPAGSKYAYVINDAIQKCSCMLLLLSEQSQESEWVEKEIERAVNYKKPIISMHLDESELNSGFSFYLGNQQIVPIRIIDRNDSNVQKVLSAIKSYVR